MIRSLFPLVSLCVSLVVGGCAEVAPSAVSGASAGPAAPGPAAPGPAGPATRTVRNVDVATLKADLDRAAVPLLVDVRTPAEFAGGHVPGAKNVPLDEIDARFSEFGSDATEVYVICQSGGRSARASASLAAKGLRPVNITGGTSAWQAAGFGVE